MDFLLIGYVCVLLLTIYFTSMLPTLFTFKEIIPLCQLSPIFQFIFLFFFFSIFYLLRVCLINFYFIISSIDLLFISIFKTLCGCLKFYNKYFKFFWGYLQIIVNCFTCGVRILFSQILISTTCLHFPTHCYKTHYTVISNASMNALFLPFQIYISVLYLCHTSEKNLPRNSCFHCHFC